ncbi:GNAT family N-acetyltransferase [Cyclobacterium jeungdonense]|uniref:GNAT family N-acetyltransferase n=2 Tax=Cyclobacterium jeungdonense TaxID=708087 RepID=A0ABT8C9R1_9BACT|nr:GNAT family N-acetyltransferase [Cyclobacterium jeungdonense]MDN3689255.1 GNAT family N-acetyltransferase [Cyclobacterium jeungdonense]
MIQILPAGIDQIPLVQKMATETWPSAFGKILSQEQLAYMMREMYSTSALKEQMEKKGHRFLIGYEERKALGFTSFETNYLEKPHLKIHKLYILPEAQGKGLGSRFLKALETRGQKEAMKSLELNVNKYNKQALDFYYKMGFKKFREEVIPIGNGFVMDDFSLIKPI